MIDQDTGRKSTELETSTSDGSNVSPNSRISKEQNNHSAPSTNSNDQLAEGDMSSLESLKDRGKPATI